MNNTITKVCCINDLPYESRPINRITEFGPSALSDNELFAVITGTKNLINYDDIESLMNMDITELKSSGLSSGTANKITAMMELSKRIWRRSLPQNEKLNTPLQIASHIMSELKYLEREQLRLLCLNNCHQLIHEEVMTIGTCDSSLVSVREILIKCLQVKASRIAIAHNHPTGTAHPSNDDINTTSRLKEGCIAIGIKLVDHIIISHDTWYSFAEHGVL